MKKLLALTAAMTAIFAVRASASDVLDQKYFTVDEGSIQIEEITARGGTIPGTGPTGTIPGPDQLPKPPSGPQINPPGPQINPPKPGGPDSPKPPEGGNGGTPAVDPLTNINNTIDTLDKIVNLMEKIFAIIEKNQPVVNVTTNYANAVPFGTTHWTQLQGWSKPATRKYAFSMKNAYGSEVVKVTYQVHYTYKGNFQGKGKFLTGVTIEPLNIVTAWGYKVTLVSEVPDSTVANVGTHEDPVASMQVQLKWTVHTMVKDITSKAIYYVQGDGALEEIGTPFQNAKAIKLEKKIEGAKTSVNASSFN